MNTSRAANVLYIVACGGRPAGDLPDFVRHAQEQGWEACVVATPSGSYYFIDGRPYPWLFVHPLNVMPYASE